MKLKKLKTKQIVLDVFLYKTKASARTKTEEVG